MGLRGRVPIPAAVHAIRGTKQRSNTGDGLQLPIKVPEPPEYLGDAAKAEFRRLAALMEDAGIVATIDGDLLAVLAQNLTDFARVTVEIDGLSMEEGIRRGLVKARDRYVSVIARLSKEFGMSPSGRLRLKGPQKQAEEEKAGIMVRKRQA